MGDMNEQAIPASCAPAWAHTTGHLDVIGPQPVIASIDVLADREYARETAIRYSYAYDERRLDLLEQLLTPDAAFSVTIGGGGDFTVRGRGEVIDWLAEIMHGQPDQRRHLVSNVVIEDLTATTAVVVTYLAIYSIEAQAVLATTGFYRFSLLKDASTWRIAHILDGLDRPF